MSDQYHHHYDHYDPTLIERLDGFYGKVEDKIHSKMIKFVHGPKVLDIGCGYGSCVQFLVQHGFEAIGIDQHEPSVRAGQQRYPKLNLKYDQQGLEQFTDNFFNTIILKDVVHHIYDEDDIVTFLKDAFRICKDRLIIIDPNPMPILKFARKLIGHVDPVCPPNILKKFLKDAGFKHVQLSFSEVIAFPLSGGYVGPNWIKSPLLMKLLLGLDRALERLLSILRLSHFFCWRYYIVASK